MKKSRHGIGKRDDIMTVQEVKAVLSAARKAGCGYLAAKRRHTARESRITFGKCVSYENDGAVHERDGNPVEQALCSLSDAATDVERAKQALSEPYIKASRLICLVADAQLRQLLNLRYLHSKSWEDIAAAMNISVRWGYELHGKALKKISKELSKRT